MLLISRRAFADLVTCNCAVITTLFVRCFRSCRSCPRCHRLRISDKLASCWSCYARISLSNRRSRSGRICTKKHVCKPIVLIGACFSRSPFVQMFDSVLGIEGAWAAACGRRDICERLCAVLGAVCGKVRQDKRRLRRMCISLLTRFTMLTVLACRATLLGATVTCLRWTRT